MTGNIIRREEVQMILNMDEAYRQAFNEEVADIRERERLEAAKPGAK